MKQTYMQSIAEINSRLAELTAVDKTIRNEQLIKELHASKININNEYIEIAKPCSVGDKFRCISRGGRQITGIVASFVIFGNEVMIESYYPVVKGVKKSTMAYFSVPYTELVKL